MEKNLQTSEKETQEQKIIAEKNPAEEKVDNPQPPKHDEQPKPAVDYREKFGESTRENQVLAGQLAEKERQLGMAIKAEPPTEAELKTEYPEWDELTSFEKRMATEALTLKKQVAKATLLAQQAQTEAVSERAFTDILRKKNSDGTLKYPGLRDREDDFRAYCNMSSHKGAPLETLANAFLYEIGEQPKPIQKTDVDPKPVLERTSGGDKPANSAEISDEDAAVIRKNDPKHYAELIKSGKIKNKKS